MAARMTGGTFFCVPNALVFEHLASLSGAAAKVYFVLRCHLNTGTDQAWPSYRKIQELAGLQSEAVAKAVKELVAAGLVTVERQGRKSNYHFDNRSTSENEPLRKAKSIASETEVKPLRKAKTNKTNEQNELTRGRDAVASHYTPAFEQVWQAYGRKGTKSTAAKEFARHAKGVPLAAILAAIPIYFATRRVNDGFKLDCERFISRHIWENPTLGEENDIRPRASPASNGHQTFRQQGVASSVASIQKVAAAKREYDSGHADIRAGDDGTDRRLSARVRDDRDDRLGVDEIP